MTEKIVTKKTWVRPRIIDVGSVDAQTTAGVGNVGDQATAQNRYKAGTIDIPEDAKVILPDGE
jgi:hypothetical protein